MKLTRFANRADAAQSILICIGARAQLESCSSDLSGFTQPQDPLSCCKSLVNATLKRLASAVHLRP
jgi:hypothetical protein